MTWNRSVRNFSLSICFVLFGFALPNALRAQVETLFTGIGMDTRIPFPHTSLPGATGIDFRFAGAFAAAYPPEESHIVVITFEWRASDADPWSSSPDNAKSIPGATTTFFDTGVYHGPADASQVAIHFFGGGLMTVSGDFSHISVVPEPRPVAFFVIGVFAVSAWAWRRGRSDHPARPVVRKP